MLSFAGGRQIRTQIGSFLLSLYDNWKETVSCKIIWLTASICREASINTSASLFNHCSSAEALVRSLLRLLRFSLISSSVICGTAETAAFFSRVHGLNWWFQVEAFCVNVCHTDNGNKSCMAICVTSIWWTVSTHIWRGIFGSISSLKVQATEVSPGKMFMAEREFRRLDSKTHWSYLILLILMG